MSFLHSFLYGLLGALVVYLAIFRQKRLKLVFEKSENWKVIVFDLVIFLICGATVTAILASPSSPKEAFLAGGTWQGLLAGARDALEDVALDENHETGTEEYHEYPQKTT